MAIPKVSVLLPVHNGEHYVGNAIESVLQQTFADFQLLIIDDCSTDSTADRVNVFNDPRIMLVTNPSNLGIQRSLNIGLRKAQGEFIARIDDDDVWSDRDKLKKQMAFLQNNSDCSLIGTGAIVADEARKELYRFLNPCEDIDIRRAILGRNCFVHSSVVFRKVEALKHGGYSESPEKRHVEDYDLWLAMGRTQKFANLPEYSVTYLMRGASVSGKHRIEQYTNNLHLVWRYAPYYPNKTLSILRSVLRLVLYGYLNLSGLRAITARFK